MKTITSLLLFIACLHWSCQRQSSTPTKAVTTTTPNTTVPFAGKKMGGLSFVAPPRPFSYNPMPEIQAVGANWIAVIPFGFSIQGKPRVHFDSDRQWWGERPEGTIETIRLAQKAGLKILLKPQVYICLLYTSPSPRDATLSRMPSSA